MQTANIALVVFDLAGTVVDYGSRAPAGAFCELFRRHGVAVSEAEARIPMGKHKRDHISDLLAMPAIAARWRERHGREWLNDDLDALFAEFLPLQLAALPRFADAIPGAAALIRRLRRQDIRVAATTGYNREMTDLLLDLLAPQGLVFDAVCCAAEVPAGRPRPWMIQRCMEALDVFPPGRVVNVGDTLADVRAGANAGVWSVGVTMTGNLVGLSRDEAEALPAAEAERLHGIAARSLRAAGADAVIESVAELQAVLDVCAARESLVLESERIA